MTETETQIPAPDTPAPVEKKKDGTVLKTLKSPGKQPFGLAFDGESLWVADSEDRKIYKIDPEEGRVMFTIAFDGHLAGTAWDGTHVWQADQTSRTISRINPETGAIDMAIKIEIANGDVMGAWYESAEEASGLWYALSRLGQARKVRTEDGAFMKAYPTHAGICGLQPVGKHIFYTETATGTVHKMHVVAGALLMSYHIGGEPTGICHDGEAFWIADRATAELHRMKF